MSHCFEFGTGRGAIFNAAAIPRQGAATTATTATSPATATAVGGPLPSKPWGYYNMPSTGSIFWIMGPKQGELNSSVPGSQGLDGWDATWRCW